MSSRSESQVSGIVLLHLSDLHFGNKNRFQHLDTAGLKAFGQRFSQAVRETLAEDLKWKPAVDLIVVSGDIAEVAKPKEFDQGHAFLTGMREALQLPPERTIFVPGNHDYNWALCKKVDVDREIEEFDDAEYLRRINAVKFRFYTEFLEKYYGCSVDQLPARTSLDANCGAYLCDFSLDGRRLSFAALNTSEMETHKTYGGELGETQAKALMAAWMAKEYDDSVKIAIVHHNPLSTPPENRAWTEQYYREQIQQGKLSVDPDWLAHYTADMIGLRHAERLQQIVNDASAHLVLHGHHHNPTVPTAWLRKAGGVAPVLSVGSFGLKPGQIPTDQPLTYQLILFQAAPEPKLIARPLEFDPNYRLTGTLDKGQFRFNPKSASNYDGPLPSPPTWKLEPQTHPPSEVPIDWNATIEPYLDWIIKQHSTLDLPGLRRISHQSTVPLEKVFVALRGDRTTSDEWNQSCELLINEVMDGAEDLTREEFENKRAEFLRINPIVATLRERDRIHDDDRLTLGEAFQKERCLVILGDPGSGKTTLGRWLSLKLARSLKTRTADKPKPRVEVPLNQIDPESQDAETLVSLGEARLPVLVRIADYAEWRAKREKGQDLSLTAFLGHHSWLNRFPDEAKLPPSKLNELIVHYLEIGQCVIILDGMDEITTSGHREDIVDAIETFIRSHIRHQEAVLRLSTAEIRQREVGDSRSLRLEAELLPDEPIRTGGNQIIITSRIAGYHASPIRVKQIAHVTIEPMRPNAVRHFCDAWMDAVTADEMHGLAPERIAMEAKKEADGLKNAIFDERNFGVRELATNPLLITILALVYRNFGRQLPPQRAELYDIAMEILVEAWRPVEGLDKARIIDVLTPIAEYIHENFPTGLIDERNLMYQMRKQLAPINPGMAQLTESQIDRAVQEFVVSVKNDIGLLAARGEKLYGFLHLTFQEYLAARSMVRVLNPDQVAMQIAGRLADARWHEPILLALGYVSWRWPHALRDQLLKALLDSPDPLGDLLPRAALLIVEASYEMPEVSTDVLCQIMQDLLRTYANRELLSQFEDLKARLEGTFIRLRRGGHARVMDKVLSDTLRNPDAQHLRTAAALLINFEQWYSPMIVEALLEALPFDDESADFPIDRCLRDIVAPDDGYDVLKTIMRDRLSQNWALKAPDNPTTPLLRDVADLEEGKTEEIARQAVEDYEARIGRVYLLLKELADRMERGIFPEAVELRDDLRHSIKGIERLYHDLLLNPSLSESADSDVETWNVDLLRETLREARAITHVADETGQTEYQSRQSRLTHIRNGEYRLELIATLDKARTEYRTTLARYNAAVQVFMEYKSRADLIEKGRLPAVDLPMRQELQSQILLQRVQETPHWLRLITMIYGGYYDLQADRIAVQYSEIAWWLQRPDQSREDEIDKQGDFYLLYFGYDDIAYNAAVVLDTVGKEIR